MPCQHQRVTTLARRPFVEENPSSSLPTAEEGWEGSGGFQREQGVELIRLLFGGILRQAQVYEPALAGVEDVELAGALQALENFVPLFHFPSPSRGIASVI